MSGSLNQQPSYEELGVLRSVMRGINSQTRSYTECFLGDDSRADTFVQNVNSILRRNSCIASSTGGSTTPDVTSTVKEGSSADGSSSSWVTELNRLRVAMDDINRQLEAFRVVAGESKNIEMFLISVDAVIARNSSTAENPLTSPPSTTSVAQAVSADESDCEVEIIKEVKTEEADRRNMKLKIEKIEAKPISYDDVSTSTSTCSKFQSEIQSGESRKRKVEFNEENSAPNKVKIPCLNLEGSDGNSSADEVTIVSESLFHSESFHLEKIKVQPSFFNSNTEIHKTESTTATTTVVGRIMFAEYPGEEDYEMNYFEELNDSMPMETQLPAEGNSSEEQSDNENGGHVEADLDLVNDPGQAKEIPVPVPQENIFENEKILATIFNNFGLRDMKNIRCVNKQWKNTANEILIQKQMWALIIDSRFAARYKGRRISHLNKVIASCPGTFPLTSLVIDYVSLSYSCSNSHIRHFFDTHGPNITALDLQYYIGSVEGLEDIIVEKLTNVRDLVARTIWFQTRTKELLLPPIQLPSLQTLTFDLDATNEEHCAYFKAILRAAVNLKELKNVQLHMLKAIGEVGPEKLKCIKTFTFDPQTNAKGSGSKTSTSGLRGINLNSFKKFVQIQPKLSSLSIKVASARIFPEFITGLSSILQSSKDTLHSLEIPALTYLPGLKLPILKNLKYLEIFHSVQKNVKTLERPAIFGERFNFGNTFPTVEALSCDLVGVPNEVDWISKYFPCTGANDGRSFPGVKLFEFKKHYNFGNALHFMLPHLTHIRILKFDQNKQNGQPLGLTCGLREVDGLKNLEILELRGFRFSGKSYRLDSLFTGIPQEEFGKLDMRFKANAPTVLRAHKNLPQNPFYKLSGLKRVKIIFDHIDNLDFAFNQDPDPDENGLDSPARPVITPFSCLLGFSMLKNLKEVVFAYDFTLATASEMAEVFQPLSEFPYVKIEHADNVTVI